MSRFIVEISSGTYYKMFEWEALFPNFIQSNLQTRWTKRASFIVAWRMLLVFAIFTAAEAFWVQTDTLGCL